MKVMILKYNKSIILFFVLSFCLSVFSKSQTPPQDTASTSQYNKTHIAYGNQPSWLVTGAVSTIGSSEIQSPFIPNFLGRLNGRIPGLSIVSGGTEPGYQNTMAYIRGINTFGVGGTAILILVDGLESNMADLVPEEIESISVLKDASATAMYGSRGANGVILVTTKRGEEGKLKVVFSTQHGIQSPSRLPQFLNSYDYARDRKSVV